MLLAHGLGKFMKIFTYPPEFADPLGVGILPSLLLAVFAEALCSTFVVLGIFTRLAVIPLVITMAVAFFLVHGGDPWKVKELAALYGVAFVSIGFLGGGKYALTKRWN